jgi:hypothetical protein
MLHQICIRPKAYIVLLLVTLKDGLPDKSRGIIKDAVPKKADWIKCLPPILVPFTSDYYRYFDTTLLAEFLYECVERTIDKIIPEEVGYLKIILFVFTS